MLTRIALALLVALSLLLSALPAAAACAIIRGRWVCW